MFEILGKYSIEWPNSALQFKVTGQDIAPVPAGHNRKMYAFG